MHADDDLEKRARAKHSPPPPMPFLGAYSAACDPDASDAERASERMASGLSCGRHDRASCGDPSVTHGLYCDVATNTCTCPEGSYVGICEPSEVQYIPQFVCNPCARAIAAAAATRAADALAAVDKQNRTMLRAAREAAEPACKDQYRTWCAQAVMSPADCDSGETRRYCARTCLACEQAAAEAKAAEDGGTGGAATASRARDEAALPPRGLGLQAASPPSRAPLALGAMVAIAALVLVPTAALVARRRGRRRAAAADSERERRGPVDATGSMPELMARERQAVVCAELSMRNLL
jgi:hypothetical protein